MKNLFLLCIALLGAVLSYAQTNELLSNYSFEDNPNYFNFNDDEIPLIGVKEYRILDYELSYSGNLVMYELTHKAYILNTDDEIERNNKLYIPYTSSSASLEKIEARVIKKDGEIINLDKTKILTAKDEKSGQEFKYYAYEGIEKGCVIEYLTILKQAPRYMGTKLVVQSEFPKNNYDFHLFAPGHLGFKFNEIGKIDEVKLDTVLTTNELNHWQIQMDSIVALAREDQSAYNAHVGAIIYKLDKNYAKNSSDIVSYNTITQNIFESLMIEPSKSEKKVVKKIINDSSCLTSRNEKSKIRAVEDHLKQKYQVVQSGEDRYTNFSSIYQNHQVAESSLVKLFHAIFKELEVDIQLVITCNRYNNKFDKTFQSYHLLGEYLFYFPKLKLYMSPKVYESRLGYAPPTLTGNNGLFIREVEVGGIKSAVSKIKYIDPIAKELSTSGVKIEITLDEEDVANSEVKIDRELGGYNAMYTQPFMSIMTDEDKNELTDEIIQFIDESIEINNKIVYHDDAFYYGIEPFRITGDFLLSPLVQNAGENSIVEVGKLIGPQSEMYQEQDRVLPLEARYLRTYKHEIIINIPEKYTIKNMDDLNIHEEFEKDGEVMLYFDSSYTFENNVLTISVFEYYGMIEVSPEEFNDYRRIVNCAADFNKVALVIE